MGVNFFKPPSGVRVPFGGTSRPRIDVTHPLAGNLIGCWVPGISYGVNLTGASPDLVPNNVAGANYNDGPAIDLTTSDARLGVLAPPAFTSWNNLTLYWRGVLIGTPTNYPMLVGISYSDPGGYPYSVASLHRRSGATGIFAQSNNAGTEIDETTITVSSSLNEVSAAATFVIGGNITTYLNGVFQGATALAGAPSSTATSTLGIGYTVLGTPTFNGYTHLGYIWNRALSADEIATLDANPYVFLLPAEGEWPAVMAAIAAVTRGSTLPFMGVG